MWWRLIDMLGQSELSILVEPRLPSKIFQGVTTEITGEGNSVAPLDDSIIRADRRVYEHYGVTPEWRTLRQYFARLEKQGIGINFATYVGATSVRRMVRKFTALPAQRMGLTDRGVLKEGMWADIVIFDPATIRDTATFESPNRLSEGMEYVLVNGVPVIEGGTMTGALPGRILHGPGYEP